MAKIKSCKGCKYLNVSIFGTNCTIDTELEWRRDPFSERVSYKTIGNVETKVMRAREGRCGPDRMLFDTHGRAFLRWITKGRVCGI